MNHSDYEDNWVRPEGTSPVRSFTRRATDPELDPLAVGCNPLEGSTWLCKVWDTSPMQNNHVPRALSALAFTRHKCYAYGVLILLGGSEPWIKPFTVHRNETHQHIFR